MEVLSLNSFGTITAGIQYLVDCSFQARMDPRIGRYFEVGKADSSAVSAWEGQLKNWGDRSLDRLSAEERKKESSRREMGAQTAKQAAQDAAAAGGELTVGPMISEGSPLSASRNMLMLAAPPSQVLDYVAMILDGAARGDEDLKTVMTQIRADKLAFGLRITDQYKPIFQAEMQRQLPIIQKFTIAKRTGATPPLTEPSPPVPPKPKGPTMGQNPAYSQEEKLEIQALLATGSYSNEVFKVMTVDLIFMLTSLQMGIMAGLKMYLHFGPIFEKITSSLKISVEEMQKLKGKEVGTDQIVVFNAIKEKPQEMILTLLGNGYLFVDMPTAKIPSKSKIGTYMLGVMLSSKLGTDVTKQYLDEALTATSKSDIQTMIANFVGGVAGMFQSDSLQLIIVHESMLIRTSAEIGTGVCFELSGTPMEVPSADFKSLGETAASAISASMATLYIIAFCIRGEEEPVKTGDDYGLDLM